MQALIRESALLQERACPGRRSNEKPSVTGVSQVIQGLVDVYRELACSGGGLVVDRGNGLNPL